MSSSSNEVNTFDSLLRNRCSYFNDARGIISRMNEQSLLRNIILVQQTGRYYECAIYDILLQLYLIYWRMSEEKFDSTNVYEEVDITVTMGKVVISRPSSLIGVDFEFDYRLDVNTLFVDKRVAERYEVLREPFVCDFRMFLRQYCGILPNRLYKRVQEEKNKFGLLTILREGRR